MLMLLFSSIAMRCCRGETQVDMSENNQFNYFTFKYKSNKQTVCRTTQQTISVAGDKITYDLQILA